MCIFGSEKEELFEGVNHAVERTSVVRAGRKRGPMMGRQALTMAMLGSTIDQIAVLSWVPVLDGGFFC